MRGRDVGIDEGTPVTEDYTTSSSYFSGQIYQVTITVRPTPVSIKDKADKAAQQFLIDKAAAD